MYTTLVYGMTYRSGFIECVERLTDVDARWSQTTMSRYLDRSATTANSLHDVDDDSVSAKLISVRLIRSPGCATITHGQATVVPTPSARDV